MTNSDKLRALLRRKFPKDQYAMIYEVRDAAGFSANRSADCLVIGLWPSRGCKIEGFEIKSYRNDWLRELKKPEKADAFVKFCDHWWVLAGDDSVVKLSEVPETWGLMVPRGGGLGVVKDAPRLTPVPVERGFLAAMLKRACMTSLDTPEVQAEIERIKDAESARRDREIESYKNAHGHDLRSLQGSLADFEKVSGVKIREWDGKRIGEAVNLVLQGGHQMRLQELQRIRHQVEGLKAWMDENVPKVIDDGD